MSEIKRYTYTVNEDYIVEFVSSEKGEMCFASEVEALPKRIKELEDQLQQKQEEVDKINREHIGAIQRCKEYKDSVEKQLTSYKELMGRMATRIEGFIGVLKESNLNESAEYLERTLTDYKKLEG